MPSTLSVNTSYYGNVCPLLDSEHLEGKDHVFTLTQNLRAGQGASPMAVANGEASVQGLGD